jgi:AraC-like DNA-binding protein
MQADSGTSAGPGLRAISISEALAGWHQMICGETDEAEHGSGVCRYLDARISPEVGSGSLDLITFDNDFILLNMRGHFHDDLNYKIVGEGWTRLHFRKSARAAMDFGRIGQTELEGPLCQILHQPEGVEDEEWIEGGVHLEWITLLMRPELLVERFKLDSVSLIDPVRRLANGADDFLLKNWSLSPDMIQAMSQLLGNRYNGELKRVHLEAKAIELICMMANVMTDRPGQGLPVKLSAGDVERLHEAREILSRTYADPPGIEKLSRRVGLNRNKLSYGFKHLFDMTISVFCVECRLQAAWELLRDSPLSVSQIANQVGYAQPAAFSTAFRERFSMTPRQTRNRQSQA